MSNETQKKVIFQMSNFIFLDETSISNSQN